MHLWLVSEHQLHWFGIIVWLEGFMLSVSLDLALPHRRGDSHGSSSATWPHGHSHSAFHKVSSPHDTTSL